jgi:hypothetical protein
LIPPTGNSDPERLQRHRRQFALPQTVFQSWGKLAAAAKVEATLRSVRHTHVSHLIAAAVDIPTISRRIGHSLPTITLDVYGHLMPQTGDKAAAAIEIALTAPKTETEQTNPRAGGNRPNRGFSGNCPRLKKNVSDQEVKWQGR